MPETKPTITILGFGAFGSLLARLLAPHAAVSVFDTSAAAARAARDLGVPTLADPAEITADIVILAVPLTGLEPCLTALAPHLRAGQLVVDVCSVKEEPARLMARCLPGHVDILACHPMFGPESARMGLAGSQVVFCPVRGAGWRPLAAFLKRRLRLDVVVTTPEEHDRQAALTQGLTHLLARALGSLGEVPRIRTRSFSLMADALAMVAGDASEVFEAVTRGNRHVSPLCEDLSREILSLVSAPPEGAPNAKGPAVSPAPR